MLPDIQCLRTVVLYILSLLFVSGRKVNLVPFTPSSLEVEVLMFFNINPVVG